MIFHRSMATLHVKHVNRVALRLAGRGSLADVEHVGRRSGTVRHTPLRAFRSGDQVVIGVNFGTRSDWLRNIQAAGHCRMFLHGEWLELGEPRIVPVREGVRDMPWWFGFGLRFVVRTRHCVVLPVTARVPADRRTPPSSPPPPSPPPPSPSPPSASTS